MNEKKSFNLLNLGLMFLFLSLLTLATYLFFRVSFSTKKEINSQDSKKEKVSESESNWEVYSNTEFGISFAHPRLLYKKEFRNQAGSLYFVRFEETKFSRGKGIAVGVKEGNLEEEVANFKKEFENQADLTKESQIIVNTFKGVRLDFEPRESSLLEKRSIVILEKSGKVYSISTVPKQIDRVLESFNFI